MINILHIITGLNIGGAEMMLLKIIKSHQNKKNYKHSVISLTGNGKVGEILRGINIDVHLLEIQNIFDLPRKFLNLIQIIFSVKPDIVQTWMYHADFLGGVASYLAGYKRVIWGVRSTELSQDISRPNLVLRKLCALLSWWLPLRVVCAADASRRSHIAFGYDPSRMVVINNGFDLNSFVITEVQRSELREECGFNIDDVVVGIVSRFHRVKDLENFVRAAGLVAQKNKKVRFLMIGRDVVVENSELMLWVTKTGNANRFVLLGERSDIPACLASMDIFCLSSYSEGFPNVIGEAMTTRLPCVVTDVGDAAKLVGDCGVVVPKKDSIALAQGLSQVLEMTPESRLRLGQSAYARIKLNFTIEQSCNRFEKLYLEVLEMEDK
jgi:glycosyltransferase involved in cell wall biosynthesis